MESLSKRAQWSYPAIHNERRPRLNDETNNRSNTYQKNPRKKEYERERRMEYRVFTTRKNWKGLIDIQTTHLQLTFCLPWETM